MATATKTQKQQTPATPDQTPTGAELVSKLNDNSLDALLAQQKALAEQIKAARLAQPKQSPLEKEIARQQEAGIRNGFVAPFYAKMIARRIALGQDRDTAIAEVQALWQAWTLAALDSMVTTE